MPKVSFDSRPSQLITLRVDNEYVASVVLSGYDGECMVSDLFVEHGQRRQGYGRQLMQHVIDSTTLPLVLKPEPSFDCGVDKKSLERFYRSLGFMPIEEGVLREFFRRPIDAGGNQPSPGSDTVA